MSYWFRKLFSNAEAHGQALYEVATVAIFSIAPFAVTYFVRAAQEKDGHSVSISDLVGRGQLYLLAYGVFGTVLWLAFLKSDRPKHGARSFLGLIAIILVFPIIGFLGVDPTFSTVLNIWIINLGYFFYFSFLALNYLLLFYMNIEPPQPTEILGQEVDAMRQRYEEMNDAR